MNYLKEVKANLSGIMVVLALLTIGVAVGDPVLAYGSPLVFAAVVTVKSSLITNRDAVPSVLKSRILQGAPILHARGVVAIANGDSVASKYLLFSLPSNAVPISLRVTCPDIGTTTVSDVGLYKTTRDGSAVVDADFFASALSLSGGALTKSEALFESGVVTVANSEKMIWEHLALTADPQIPYDVVLTLTGAADAAGSVLVECDYVVG